MLLSKLQNRTVQFQQQNPTHKKSLILFIILPCMLYDNWYRNAFKEALENVGKKDCYKIETIPNSR